MDGNLSIENGAARLDDGLSLPRIGGGNTAEIYEYEGDRVIKLYREGFPVQGIRKEYDVGRKVQEAYAQLPRTLALVCWRSRLGILYEKVTGKDMFLVMGRSPASLRRAAAELASIHAGIHETRISDILPVREKLAGEIGKADDLTAEEKAGALRILASLPDGDRLCHFDFHPGNVMVTETGYRVLDWMTACAGDPAADVARTWLLLRYGELINAGFGQRLRLKAAKAWMRRRYLSESLRLSGMRREEIERWIVPVAAARLSEWLTDRERKRLAKLVRKGLRN